MRTGIDTQRWMHEVERLDRKRDRELRRVTDLASHDGIVVIWVRHADGSVEQRPAHIQPGVADDLPSLLSALSVEIGWPGISATAGNAPAGAVAIWARMWQVREGRDLRVLLSWTPAGEFQARAELLGLDGSRTVLQETPGMVELLDRLSVIPESSQSPHGLLIAGNRAMLEHDYAGARACYQRAVTDLPRHPEAHRNLALALARLSEWEAAAQVMLQALALAPKDAQLGAEYLALETDAGIQAAQRGDLEQAAAHFLRILERWPDEPTALVNLGNIRLREGRTREARAIFRRYLRLHPDHPGANAIRLALEELGPE